MWKHGVTDAIIGIEITRNTQPNEMAKIRQHFFTKHNKTSPPTYTPYSKVFQQAQSTYIQDHKGAAPTVKEYRVDLGVLGYSRYTRNHIKTPLSIAAGETISPTRPDSDALIVVAAYLITTEDVGLIYQVGPSGADIRRPIPQCGSCDASWATRKGGASQLGYCVVAGDMEIGVFQAPTVAKTYKENDGHSESASTGELKALVANIQITGIRRGISEELAGWANEQITQLQITGSTNVEEVVVKARMSHENTREAILSPSTINEDNRSLAIVIGQDVSNKAKKLRLCARWINYARQESNEERIKIQLVTTSQQLVDPMKKVDKSPSRHVEKVEWLQGSHIAVTLLQQKVQQRIASRKTQRKQSGTIEDEEEQKHANMARWNTNENSTTTDATTRARLQNTKHRRGEGSTPLGC
jgi:hypothetical protein